MKDLKGWLSWTSVDLHLNRFEVFFENSGVSQSFDALPVFRRYELAESKLVRLLPEIIGLTAELAKSDT